MAVFIELLACKFISPEAMKALEHAACPIHREVPGIDNDTYIVELQHAGEKDRGGMYVWDIPREIQITSRGLDLAYQWSDEVNGYALTMWDEDMRQALLGEKQSESSDEDLGDLDAHPF